MAGGGGGQNKQLREVVTVLLQHTSTIVNCCTLETDGFTERLQIRIQPGLVFVTLMEQQ